MKKATEKLFMHRKEIKQELKEHPVVYTINLLDVIEKLESTIGEHSDHIEDEREHERCMYWRVLHSLIYGHVGSSSGEYALERRDVEALDNIYRGFSLGESDKPKEEFRVSSLISDRRLG